MKKLLCLILALSCGAMFVSAQKGGAGFKFGVNFSDVNGVADSKGATGIALGWFVEKPIAAGLSLETGMMWSQQGFKLDIELTDRDITNRIRVDYINLPITLNCYLAGGLSLKLGTQFGYLTGAKIKTSDGWGDPYSTDIKKYINKFNADMIAGLGYNWSCGLVFDLRYHIGLVNLYKGGDFAGDNVRNGYLQLAAGWKF